MNNNYKRRKNLNKNNMMNYKIYNNKYHYKNN